MKTTDNGFGVMMERPDPFARHWARAAALMDRDSCAMEIGAAFGVSTLDALRRGAPAVVAVDIAQSHLESIVQQWNDETKQGRVTGRLHTLHGAIPEVLTDWRPPQGKRLTTILSCNVLHFLSPEEIFSTVSRLFELAAEGAELLITVDSPWIMSMLPLLPLYAVRRCVSSNPGYVRLNPFIKKWCFPPRLHGIEAYHPMEPRHLADLLTAAGWTVLRACYFDGDSAGNPSGVTLLGGEMTGVHAIKRT